MRIWSNFVIKVICIYIGDISHSFPSPFWDYTHIFLDIPILCKLLMDWAGFCSHDMYAKASHPLPESRVVNFLDTLWILHFPYCCPGLCPWQTSLIDCVLPSAEGWCDLRIFPPEFLSASLHIHHWPEKEQHNVSQVAFDRSVWFFFVSPALPLISGIQQLNTICLLYSWENPHPTVLTVIWLCNSWVLARVCHNCMMGSSRFSTFHLVLLLCMWNIVVLKVFFF